VDERPAVVVVAGSAADVVQAVRHARAHGMRIAPQGTGHGAAPLEPLDGAMLQARHDPVVTHELTRIQHADKTDT
jgi:FAD/FMN-containing dehydrogenase